MPQFIEHDAYTSRWIADNFPPIEDLNYFYNRKEDHVEDFYTMDRNYDLIDYLYGQSDSYDQYNDNITYNYSSSDSDEDYDYYE
jgi:hypothetical protein